MFTYDDVAFIQRENIFKSFQDYLIGNRGISLNTEFDSMVAVRTYVKKGDIENDSIDYAIDIDVQGKLLFNV